LININNINNVLNLRQWLYKDERIAFTKTVSMQHGGVKAVQVTTALHSKNAGLF